MLNAGWFSAYAADVESHCLAAFSVAHPRTLVMVHSDVDSNGANDSAEEDTYPELHADPPGASNAPVSPTVLIVPRLAAPFCDCGSGPHDGADDRV